MESWAIFKHAVRMVFGNLGDALRVTGVYFLLAYATPLILFGHYFAELPVSLSLNTDFLLNFRLSTEFNVRNQVIPWYEALAVLIIQLVFFILIIVSWCRYVLLNEAVRFIPQLRLVETSELFGAYVSVSLIAWALSSIIAFPVIWIEAKILNFLLFQEATTSLKSQELLILGIAGIFNFALISTIKGTIFLRYSPVFPSIALQKNLELRQALDRTKGQTKTLLGVALLLAIPLTTAEYMRTYIEPFSSMAILIFDFLVGWLTIVLAASVVTSIYQRFAESHPAVTE